PILLQQWSTPPWHCKFLPLSVTPLYLLCMLSKRAPNSDTKIVNRATNKRLNREALSGTHSAATTCTTSRDSSTPPTKPSTVLPGLTLGASLFLPNVRPAK